MFVKTSELVYAYLAMAERFDFMDIMYPGGDHRAARRQALQILSKDPYISDQQFAKETGWTGAKIEAFREAFNELQYGDIQAKADMLVIEIDEFFRNHPEDNNTPPPPHPQMQAAGTPPPPNPPQMQMQTLPPDSPDRTFVETRTCSRLVGRIVYADNAADNVALHAAQMSKNKPAGKPGNVLPAREMRVYEVCEIEDTSQGKWDKQRGAHDYPHVVKSEIISLKFRALAIEYVDEKNDDFAKIVGREHPKPSDPQNSRLGLVTEFIFNSGGFLTFGSGNIYYYDDINILPQKRETGENYWQPELAAPKTYSNDDDLNRKFRGFELLFSHIERGKKEINNLHFIKDRHIGMTPHQISDYEKKLVYPFAELPISDAKYYPVIGRPVAFFPPDNRSR